VPAEHGRYCTKNGLKGQLMKLYRQYLLPHCEEALSWINKNDPRGKAWWLGLGRPGGAHIERCLIGDEKGAFMEQLQTNLESEEYGMSQGVLDAEAYAVLQKNKKNMHRLFKAYHTATNAEGNHFISVSDMGRMLRECKLYDDVITKEVTLQLLLTCNSQVLAYWITGAEQKANPEDIVESHSTFTIFFKLLRCLAVHKAKAQKQNAHLPEYLQELFTCLVTRCPQNQIKFELILPRGFE